MSDVLSSSFCNFRDDQLSFTQLSADCQRFLLNLDVQNLLEIAETNYTLSVLGADVFRKKYSNLTVEIDNDRSSSHNSNTIKEVNQSPVLIDDKTILVYGLNVSLKVLRHFGPTIKKLKIQSKRFWADEEQRIIGFVNEYCVQSESLIQLDLQITQHNTMKKLWGPFKSVVELGLDIVYSDMQEITTHNQQTLNNIFPNIRNLTLSIKSSTNMDFIGQLPNLTYLSLKGDTINSDAADTRHYQRLLRRNPQIKSLKLVFYPNDFIRMVNLYLPDLESLSLWSFDLRNYRIFFENVKKFELLSAIQGSPLKIAFRKLEELRMWYQPQFAQEWIGFFRMNPHLKRVYVEDYGENESTLDLEDLITQLSAIEDMSIFSTKSIHFETIVKFIETHRELKRFKYGSKDFDEHHTEYLKKEFHKNWTISTFNGYYGGLLFERKN